MKPGLAVGQTHKIQVEVTPDRIACFEGRVTQKLYSTAALINDLELCARKILVPFLKDSEEAIGCQAEISHLALTLPGMIVKISARVSELRDNKVVAEVEATNLRGKIARGTITLAIVEKSWLENRMKQLSVIQNITADGQNAACINSV
ncbi:MAG: hypothetical protein K2X93_17175 [Candidatus Obscuribacterales bacterium]|nr:hypothetical protein [Candidatus Obscuribacterales bacterium]